MDRAVEAVVGETATPDRHTGGLRVRLFGCLDLRWSEAPVPSLGSARAEALLGYLVLHRGVPQPREHLAFLLWPDSTRSQARTNLRHVLHRLCHSLPQADRYLEVGPQALRWRPETDAWLDVAAFEQAVADGRLQEAVDLYSGDLLEGIDDDCLREERERLAQLHRDAVGRLAHALGTQRRWEEALRYAERLVRLDPLREESYRQLIRLCHAAGERTRGLRAYHECAATLQRELGVDPASATRAAYEALLVAGDGAAAPPGRSASPTRPPLVGRATERARLTAVWGSARSGRAQLVLVTGEPGVGKSRLVEELQSWCTLTGAVAAEARAYPAEGSLPYGPVVSWLRAESITAQLPELDRVHLTELARLLPDLLAEVPGLPAPEPLPEAQQKGRLFRVLARAVVASGRPLLLVADDLQWYDEGSLQFVHYLLRTESRSRLLVAATVRREEIDAGDHVHRFLVAAEALGCVTELPLARLGPRETIDLGRHVVGRPLTPAEADRLYAESEGNPLFIIEAVRAGLLGPGSRPTATGSRAQAVLATRLAQLSTPAAELIAVAATIGREFDAPLLAEASGMEETAFVAGLDELWRRGLVRAFGPTAYDFSHGQIRTAAYRALGPARRRHQHLHVAWALQRAGGEEDALSGLIAAHLDRAGAASEAVPWYERAAHASRRLHANTDAVRLLERALELTATLSPGRDTWALQLRLLTALPPPLIAIEGYLSPRLPGIHDRARSLARRLGTEPAAPLVWSLALAMLTRGEFAAARPLGEHLRASAERGSDEILWVQSTYVLGVAAFWQGQLDLARAEFEAAIDRYRPDTRAAHVFAYGQDPECFCRMRLAYTQWLLGEEAGAETEREMALALAERSEHPYTRWAAHTWSGLLALDQHDTERLGHHLHALAPADRAEQPGQIRLAADAFAALLQVYEGRPDEGVTRLRATLATARSRSPSAPGMNGILLRILAEACAAAGDAESLLTVVDEALARDEGARLWEAELRRLRAGFLPALGTASQAADELGRALSVAQRQGARAFERRIRSGLDDLLASGTR